MLATIFWFMFVIGGFALLFCIIGMIWVSVKREKVFMILCECGLIFGICAIIGLCGWILINIF